MIITDANEFVGELHDRMPVIHLGVGSVDLRLVQTGFDDGD
jgi:hypothetical protein